MDKQHPYEECSNQIQVIRKVMHPPLCSAACTAQSDTLKWSTETVTLLTGRRTVSHLIQNTLYVVEPYKDYKNLLATVLSLPGKIDALDPCVHKQREQAYRREQHPAAAHDNRKKEDAEIERIKQSLSRKLFNKFGPLQNELYDRVDGDDQDDMDNSAWC